MARKNGMTGAIPNAGRKGEGKVKLCIVVSPEIKEIIDKEKNKSKFVSTCIDNYNPEASDTGLPNWLNRGYKMDTIISTSSTSSTVDQEAFSLMTKFGANLAKIIEVEQNLEIGVRCAILHCELMLKVIPMYIGNLNPAYDLYSRTKERLENLLRDKEKSRQR